ISIQYYGSPFTSVATYDQFKLATDTRSKTYSDRFYQFAESEISLINDQYVVNGDNGQLSFKNPDFSFNELRSNLVARWEYLPGATLCLVWQHNRSYQDAIYEPGWDGNLDRMFALPATNTFMMKASYWFNR